jgi:DNA-binding transcriptional ArsR family regulator
MVTIKLPKGFAVIAAGRKQRDSVFRAIADPTRREILRLLAQRNHTVGELSGNFRISRPAISKHLQTLRKAGLVSTRKSGTSSVCELTAKPLKAVSEWLRDYEQFWNETLSNLKIHIEEHDAPHQPE